MLTNSSRIGKVALEIRAFLVGIIQVIRKQVLDMEVGFVVAGHICMRMKGTKEN